LVKLGLIYNQLNTLDFKILEAIEKNILKYEYVPLEIIEKLTKTPDVKINLEIDKLHKLKLVRIKRVSERVFVRLTYIGLDMLALHNLVSRNIIKAIGDRIGVGKESDTYEVLTIDGSRAIAKFLRLGRTSFKRTKIKRDWVDDPRYTWFIQSKIAAQREFIALREVWSVGGYVPYPIAYSKHLVLIEYIDGVELRNKPYLENPINVFKQVIDTVKLAYLNIGIVHGDLSEYNVMVTNDGRKAYIIDWPQYVYKNDPVADELLKRDVMYISSFFRKNYGLDVDFNRVLAYVKGESIDF